MATAGPSTGAGSQNKAEEGPSSAPLTIPNDNDEIRCLRKSIDELQQKFQEQLGIQKLQLDILTEIARKDSTERNSKGSSSSMEEPSLPEWNTIDRSLEEELFLEVQESRIPNQENLSRILHRLGDYKEPDRLFQHWITVEEKNSPALTPTVGLGKGITWDSSFKDLSQICTELYADVLTGTSPNLEANWDYGLDSEGWCIEIWRRVAKSTWVSF
jgi:hypothetical protein